MISEAEILHIISEIHQYDLVLLELRDGTAFGILKGTHGRPRYLRTSVAARTPKERRAILLGAASPNSEGHVDEITLDVLLNGLKGMRPRRIWLERRNDPSHEMAFLSLKELDTFLREAQT